MKSFLVLMACAVLAACGESNSPNAVSSGSGASGGTSSAPPPASQTVSSAVVGTPITLTFPGNVFQAAVTNDGKHAFVSLSNVPLSKISSGITQADSAGSSGTVPSAATGETKVGAIAVLEKSSSGWQIRGYVPLQSTKSAMAIALFPDQSTLAIAAETAGVALINVADAVAGTAAPVYVPQGPSASGKKSSTIDVAVTNDGKFVFAANEYGQVGGAATPGNVGVVSIQTDQTGHASGMLTGNISTGQSTIPGLALSPDGATLYVANEEATSATIDALKGYDNPATGFACRLANSNSTYSGSISVIDASRAETQPDSSAILSTVAAGCETVRIAPDPDNKIVWVTARASNTIYAFDAAQLRSNPANAFISATYSGGTEPVGIALFNGGRYAAVANSNRAEATDLGPNGVPVQGEQNVTIFDVANPGNPKLLQTVASGEFPRSLSISPDGTSLLIPNFDSDTLQIASILVAASSLQTKFKAIPPSGP